MPNAALAAPTDTITVIIVDPRSPVAKRNVSGTIRKSTSCLVSMRLTRACGENAAERIVIAAYAASGQKKRGTSTRSRRITTSAAQHAIAIVSSDCAIAIENCSAAATPSTASSPACSSRPDEETSGGATLRAASAFGIRGILTACSCERAPGPDDHLLGLNPGEAPEVAGRARPLIAGPARQAVDLDRLRRPVRRAPGRGPRRQRRSVQRHDWHVTGGRDVQRDAVAADAERRAIDEHPELGKREVAAREHPVLMVDGQSRPRLRDDPIRGVP